MHEAVELVKAVAWPLVVLYFLLYYRKEIQGLLREMPDVVRRMRSAHGLGLEIELDKIGTDLPAAEAEAKNVVLPLPATPTPKQLTDQGKN
jgi:hypothetical protein